MRSGGCVDDRDIADWLVEHGFAEKFISAVEAGDRPRVVEILAKATRDLSGQTAHVLADLYLADSSLLQAVVSRASRPALKS